MDPEVPEPDPGDDNEDARFDGPCVVCGETVLNRRYIALGLFAVCTDEGDGMFFSPDEDVKTIGDWSDVPLLRVEHFECVTNYLEALVISTEHERRRGE